VARTAKATLVPSEAVHAAWIGEQVVRSAAPIVRLRVPVAADAPYRVVVAHGAGGKYGQTALAVDGRPIGLLKGNARAAAAITVFPDPVVLDKGNAVFEFQTSRRQNHGLGLHPFGPRLSRHSRQRVDGGGPIPVRRAAAKKGPLIDIGVESVMKTLCSLRSGTRISTPQCRCRTAAGRTGSTWPGDGDYVTF